MAKYNIGGYIFNDENSAKKAAKELKAVEYILGQIKVADEQEVLKIYKKILNQKLFSTQVGMSFLNQLRQNLVASGVFDEKDDPPVYSLEEPKAPSPAPSLAKEEVKADKKAEKIEAPADISAETVPPEKPEKKSFKIPKVKRKKADIKGTTTKSESGVIKRLRLINSRLIICVVTLLLCVIGMFYVSTTINSPTILNYKEVITDEFSTWKQQLDEREKELNRREAELNEREAKVSDIEEGN